MNEIFASFSSRDIALVSWLFIIIILISLKKEIRKSMFGVFEALFAKPLLISLLIFFDYILFLILILQKVGFWEISLFKTTLFWLFGSAFVLLFKLPKAKNMAFFKEVFNDVIKLTLILEFLADNYTFSFWVEFLGMLPLTFLVILQTTASFDPKHKQVENLIKSFFSFFAIFIFSRVVYKICTNFGELWTLSKAKDFLLPIILSLMFIPFIYLLALYSQYESLFIRLNALVDDGFFRRKVKWEILKVANFNINRLSNISDRIAKLLLVDESRLLTDIRKISQ